VCGGLVDGNSSREVRRLGLETLTWERLPDLTHARDRHACCVVRDGTLVALGGRDDTSASIASVEVLERGSGAWRVLPLLSCGGRRNLCTFAVEESASVEGQVCILGGEGEEIEELDEVYLVDLATGECTPQPHLGIPRIESASARLPDGRIILSGGWGIDAGGVTTAVEVWELSRGVRRWLPGMVSRRFMCSGCMLIDGRFAVFGGMEDNGTVHASCNALVLVSGAERWEPLPPMLEGRVAFTCVAVGACVIVAGGRGIGDALLSSADVYEEATGVWRRLPCDLPRAMSDMGSALL